MVVKNMAALRTLGPMAKTNSQKVGIDRLMKDKDDEARPETKRSIFMTTNRKSMRAILMRQPTVST